MIQLNFKRKKQNLTITKKLFPQQLKKWIKTTIEIKFKN